MCIVQFIWRLDPSHAGKMGIIITVLYSWYVYDNRKIIIHFITHQKIAMIWLYKGVAKEISHYNRIAEETESALHLQQCYLYV